MRFTQKQYDEAIKSLREASEQLSPDGRCCACCGDSGHQAFECGFNPLVAMEICRDLSKDASEFHRKMHVAGAEKIDAAAKLHEILHYLAGFDHYMGESIGPARVRLPDPE